jgi:hypothetical protein
MIKLENNKKTITLKAITMKITQKNIMLKISVQDVKKRYKRLIFLDIN